MRDGKYNYTLICQVSVGNFHFTFNPMRMVFYLYCNSFPIYNQDYIVTTKNGEDLDIRPDNLLLTHMPNAKSIMNRDRIANSPERNIRLFKNAILSKSVIYRMQLISCYNQKGELVKTYKDIYQAHLRTGLPVSSLEEALTLPLSVFGKYLWRSGKKKQIDVSLYHLKQLTDFKMQHGLHITQFDLNGNPINHYYSLEDAIQENHLNKNELLMCLEGNARTAGYFLWKTGIWETPIPGL